MKQSLSDKNQAIIGPDILKKVLFAMGVLLGLLFIVAAFLPARYDYRWSIEIEAAPEKIYHVIADFNNWKQWDVWENRDPEAKFTISGKPGEAGHKRTWDGPQMGKGSFSIINARSPMEISILMDVQEPNRLHLDLHFMITPLPKEHSRLTWGVSGDLVYPLGRILGIFFKGFIEPDFLSSLENIKKYIESQQSAASKPAWRR